MILPQKKYVVSLSPSERWELDQFSRTGKTAAYAITQTRILLKADTASAEGEWVDGEISVAMKVSVATIEKAREICASKASGTRQRVSSSEGLFIILDGFEPRGVLFLFKTASDTLTGQCSAQSLV